MKDSRMIEIPGYRCFQNLGQQTYDCNLLLEVISTPSIPPSRMAAQSQIQAIATLPVYN
jgi:hypothetical protein